MITIKPLSVSMMQEVGKSLLDAHYEELTYHKEHVKLNVDWKAYQALEKMGKLFAIGAWDDDTLVGYSVFVINSHLHYADTIMASNDVFFVESSKRGAMIGMRLLKECEKLLKEKNVVKITYHIKWSNTNLSYLLEHLHYGDEEFMMSKILT